MNSGRSELLSPAGDFETALAAFEAGADAVYCGLADYSARAFAKNFSFDDLEKAIAFARSKSKRVYVTFNTIVDEDRFDEAIETLARLESIGPDGLIVQDLGVARLCRRHFPSLALHASTQLVAHNLEGVLALRERGFRRVVLARELSLAEIASIARRCGDTELEVFIHGALCYSISGLCLFGAMEKGRSGNRGTCPYCCRQGFHPEDGDRRDSLVYPFSMRDLRLGDDVRRLVDVGVASLKIEGRMKSPLYVASVTRYYRQCLGEEPSAAPRRKVTIADLETVFSRRTTELYLNGAGESPLDPTSLGHLGTPVGVVKKVTKDRDGLSWLRFHTSRALEKHDGLQFEAVGEEGRHLGLGIVEMRQAISRRLVFEVNAGVDVEVLVGEDLAAALRPGMKIYCSMSNAVKRLFPTPSFRPSDYEGIVPLDLRVALSSTEMRVRDSEGLDVSIPAKLESAKDPSKTADGVRKAFSKLGGTPYRLASLEVDDPSGLFAPMSLLNDLRRDYIERKDSRRDEALSRKIAAAKADASESTDVPAFAAPRRTLRLRADQTPPPGDWTEKVVVITRESRPETFPFAAEADVRLALPVYTSEPDFNSLRMAVKRFLRAGFAKWEASDLATLRMLRALEVGDVTADWTLYAFNAQALAGLCESGVKRFVASPENSRENLQYLAESGYDVEFLVQQSTPLFISRTKPATDGVAVGGLSVWNDGGLWITTRRVPRTFTPPEGVSTRVDLSWDRPEADK